MSAIFQQILEAKEAAEKRCVELQEQRDALLAACEAMVRIEELWCPSTWSEGQGDEMAVLCRASNQLKAAIAKTKTPITP